MVRKTWFRRDHSSGREIGSTLNTGTCVHVQSLSRVRLFATPWSIACQAPLSMGCSRLEYWSGLPCPPPGDLPNPGIEFTCLTSPASAGRFCPTSSTREAPKWNSPGKNTGMGCHFLLQRIFPTQGWNPGLLQAGGFSTIWATREALNTGIGRDF